MADACSRADKKKGCTRAEQSHGLAPRKAFVVRAFNNGRLNKFITVSLPTLPSFLYLPGRALAEQLSGKLPSTQAWIIGHFARRRAAEVPGHVVRSAKSAEARMGESFWSGPISSEPQGRIGAARSVASRVAVVRSAGYAGSRMKDL